MKGLFGRLQNELEQRDKAAGLTMADVLELPDSLRSLVNWMMRKEEVTLDQVTEYLSQDDKSAQAMISALVEKGFVREYVVKGVHRYRVRIASRPKRELPTNLWNALGGKLDE